MKILNKVEELIGGVLFIILFGLLLAQISARLLGDPFTWSQELSTLMFTYMGMLGICIGIKTQTHIYIDFLTNLMTSRLKLVINSFTQLLIFISILLFVYFGFKLFSNSHFQIVSLGISEKWLYGALPICSVLMLIRFIQVQFKLKQNKLTLTSPYFYVVASIVLLGLAAFNPDVFKILDLSKLHLGKHAVYIALLFWLVIMFIGVPVGWSLFIGTILYFVLSRWFVVGFASQKLVLSLNSFTILSVPFFVLTGILMNSGGITTKIFDFAKAMLGHYRGGIGHVNVGASLIFSGMSGSALADAGGLGQLEIKAMRDAGYKDEVCGGLTAASCIIGPLVPPSIAMIIYGVIANQSIAKLFVAGFVPGVLITIVLMIMNYFIAAKHGTPLSPKASSKERWQSFKDASYALLTPIIIIGGIFSGFFTPTEAAAIAALYAVVIGMFVYKELTLKRLFDACIEALSISGVTMLMVIAVTFFGDMISREQVAVTIADKFIEFADSPLMVLVMINMLLLFLGMFIDALALQFLVLPMLIPIAMYFGIDLIFFGVMTTLNMMVGILTPPMGMALFVVARVGNMSVSTVTKGVLPFLVPIFITLVMITIFPEIITFIPNLLMP